MPRSRSTVALLVALVASLALTASVVAPAAHAASTSVWPGGSSVSNADKSDQLGENVSGLAYEGSGTSAKGTLWAVVNGPGTLDKLTYSSGNWVPQSGVWADGRKLHYPGGGGDVDAEGVTLTSAGSSAGVFVSAERDNDHSSTSRPSVERFDPNQSGTSGLIAQRDWNLTADLPSVDANSGLEGIAWVPDSYLTSAGLQDSSTGAAYAPSRYPDHGSGLFLVGLEATGTVYAYALDQSANTYHRITSFAGGESTLAELSWDAQSQRLWVMCDDTCSGRAHVFAVSGGRFTPVATYARPSGMKNYNNEGFALAAGSECSGGLKPVYWSDDSFDSGHALRAGTVSC